MVDVFLVDDSPLALEVLKRIIESIPDFRVVYAATDGEEAVKFIPQFKPDLVCLDYFMPKLNGVQLVHQILEKYPVPILVISGVISDEKSKEIFDVLEAGAVDFIPKPSSYSPTSDSAKKLIEKIRLLSRVKVIKKLKRIVHAIDIDMDKRRGASYDVVIIGSSIGGPVALHSILSNLPKNFPVPIIIVQHISPGFLTPFIDWLKGNCHFTCKIMSDNEKLEPGVLYFTPEGKNLKINDQNELYLDHCGSRELHCPNINIAMKSIAQKYKHKSIGVLLTGMGADGALGMEAIHQSGGVTIAQSEASCIVFGMPKEAIERKAVTRVLNINDIAPYLIKVFNLN